MRVENLTVRRGRASKIGGGGILNHEGTLEIWRSTIINNRAEFTTDFQVLGGGVYSFYGSMTITESIITNNRALTTNSDGGGIGIIRFKNWDNIVIQGSDIRNNHANRRGNGVYVQETGPLMHDNCFVGNYHPNPLTQTTNRSVQERTGLLRVANSWWGMPTGPLINQAATTNNDSIRGTATYVPFKTTQPLNCNRLPTALTLADYGIVIYDEASQRWSTEELNNILTGANRVGDALTGFQTTGNTVQQRFKTVMGQSIGFLRLAHPRPSETAYGIYHDAFDNNPIVSGYCQIFGSSAVIPTIVVACRGQMTNSTVWVTDGLVTQYSVIHELGHVLDLRSNLALRSYVGSNQLFLADCNGSDRLMGVGLGTDWNRGQRGWGTASQNPSPPPLQRISQFQQNPEDTPLEAAADMFLNWVYRRTSDAAPTGIPIPFNPLTNDNPAPSAACNYPNTGSWLGFANILDNGTIDTFNDRPGNVRYWWMEGTLDRIFRDLSWK